MGVVGVVATLGAGNTTGVRGGTVACCGSSSGCSRANSCISMCWIGGVCAGCVALPRCTCCCVGIDGIDGIDGRNVSRDGVIIIISIIH